MRKGRGVSKEKKAMADVVEKCRIIFEEQGFEIRHTVIKAHSALITIEKDNKVAWGYMNIDDDPRIFCSNMTAEFAKISSS